MYIRFADNAFVTIDSFLIDHVDVIIDFPTQHFKSDEKTC